eukprot:403348156
MYENSGGVQNTKLFVPKVLLIITGVELAVAAVFYGYWGFKASNTSTMNATQSSGGVLAATAIMFMMFAGFSGFTVLVLKKIDNRCITATYSFMLLVSLIIFSGIAIGGHEARDQVAKEFEVQCKNVTSDLYKVDALYGIANAQLCGTSCPCVADAKLWDQKSSNSTSQNASKSLTGSLTGGQSQTTTTTLNTGIIYSPNGAHNFPQCPGTNVTLQSFITANLSGSGAQIKLGMSVLDAVERDFDCAGMCIPSKFYAFSEVNNGPPTQTCVQGINKFMDKTADLTTYSGSFFFATTLIGFIISLILTCSNVFGQHKRDGFHELNENRY